MVTTLLIGILLLGFIVSALLTWWLRRRTDSAVEPFTTDPPTMPKQPGQPGTPPPFTGDEEAYQQMSAAYSEDTQAWREKMDVYRTALATYQSDYAAYDQQRAAHQRQVENAQENAEVSGKRFRSAAVATVVLFLLTLIATGAGTVRTVPTKEFGVVTAFGKPVRTLHNGFHLKAPWEKITKYDASVQTDVFEQDGDKACQNGKGVPVRIARQAQACADVTIRWRIKDSATTSLFQDYRNFDQVRNSLVTKDLSAALNKVFEGFDPLGVDPNGNATAPELSTLASQAQQIMTRTSGTKIEVLSIVMPIAHFDQPTQDRLNALQGQVAQTRIAAQSVKTAQQQALANKALAASVSKDPNVIVAQCMKDIADGKMKGLPAGFTCWQGGSNTQVVTPTK